MTTLAPDTAARLLRRYYPRAEQTAPGLFRLTQAELEEVALECERLKGWPLPLAGPELPRLSLVGEKTP